MLLPGVNITYQSVYFFGFVLSVRRVIGLAIVIMGWGRRSVYRMFGSIRGLIQFITYEIRLSFLFFVVFIMGGGWFPVFLI